MDAKKIKLVAFDLDGTLTQHKTKLDATNRAVLDALKAKGYELVMAGAGQCMRIFNQMGKFSRFLRNIASADILKKKLCRGICCQLRGDLGGIEILRERNRKQSDHESHCHTARKKRSRSQKQKLRKERECDSVTVLTERGKDGKLLMPCLHIEKDREQKHSHTDGNNADEHGGNYL